MPKYVGGHPSVKTFTSSPEISLKIENGKLLIKGIINVLGTIPISSIKNVSIEDSSSKRFTATRFALLGPLALAFKKQKKTFVLVVEWDDEGITHETMFLYEGFLCNQAINADYGKINEARKEDKIDEALRKQMGLSPHINSATSPSQQQSTPTIENGEKAKILEAIKQLGELHEKGILTDEEFSTKKAELLSRL